MNNFKTRDRYVVKVDRSKEESVEVGGQSLFLDTRFNQYEHITQQGEVVVLPGAERFQIENLTVGDIAYFHHFVCSEENDVSEYFGSEKTHYLVEKMNIYARTRGEHTCALQNFVFLTPIEESEQDIKTESGIYVKTVVDKMWRKGIVRFSVNPQLKGKTVFFKMNHDYEMTVAGERLYRMTEASLLAHLAQNGNHIPMPDSYVVKDLDNEERSVTIAGIELIIPGMAQADDGMRTKFKRGLVIRGGEETHVGIGSVIYYRKGLERKDEFEEGGEKFFMLKEENVEAVVAD